MSSGWPMRLAGMVASAAVMPASPKWRVISDWITPGWIELTRTPCRASSAAATLVMPRTAHLVAP